MSVENQVDDLLNNNINNKHIISHHGKRLSGFFRQFIYGALIGLLIVTITLIPIYGGRNGLEIIQEFLDSNGSTDVVSVGDPPANESAAYHYWYAPENSMGIKETKTVNWSYFKQLFLAHTDWMLEYKRYSYSSWTDGLDYLTIERTWNETGFWKFNLILDVPVDIYSARFTFGIDLQCLQYVEREGYEVWINYTANATEAYSVMFNWSDIASIPGLVITKGTYNDMFWFRFRRDNIPAGHYEFDPRFGFRGSVYESFIIENQMIGTYYLNSNGTGTADNITADLLINHYGASGQINISCALYEYGDYSSTYMWDLIAYTETKLYVADSTFTKGWLIYNFSDPKPTIENDTNYYLCVWADTHIDGYASINVSSAANRIVAEATAYGTWPSNWTGEGSSSRQGLIYCSYSEAAANNAPTITGEIPANASTGIGLTPVCNVTANDADGDSLNVTFYENTTGSYVMRQKNTSVSANSSVQWDNYSNAYTESTMYWWKVYVDDATDNVSEIYYFTTASNTSWQTIDTTINGSYSNTTVFRIIDNTINGSYFNTTVWRVIDSTINGSYSNTTNWYVIDSTINGSYYNDTIIWQNIDTTINGSYSNTTAWNIIDNTINGSYSNTTVISWQTIDSTINGSYFNETITWQTIDTTINGSYSNTSIPFVIISSTVNGSYYNTSVVVLELTNEYPSNGSNIFSVQPTLYFTLSSPVGGMSYNIYIGNTNTTTNYLLDSETGLDNGTYHYVNFYNASSFGTTYWWRVHYNDSSSHVNETFSFKPVQPGGGGMGAAGSVMGVIGLVGIFGLLGFIMHRRRRER